MMIKSAAVHYVVLLFACVLFVLLSVIVNVKANGGSNGNDIAMEDAEREMITVKEEKDMEKMAQEMEAAGNEIVKFYETFENTIGSLLQMMEDAKKELTDINEKDLKNLEGTDSDELFTKLEQKINYTKGNVSNADTKATKLKKEEQKIKSKIDDVKNVIVKLQAAIKDIKSGKDSISVQNVEQLNELIKQENELLDNILQKTDQQFQLVLGITELLTAAKSDIEEILTHVKQKQKKDIDQIKTKLKNILEFTIPFSIKTADEIKEILEKTKNNATTLLRLCAELTKKTKDLTQTSKAEEKQTKATHESSSNEQNDNKKDNSAASSELSKDAENFKENNFDSLENNDKAVEQQEQTEHEEENINSKNKQNQEEAAVSLGNGFGVVVTHFIIFTILFLLYL